jgi:DNA end-binding protein Ku
MASTVWRGFLTFGLISVPVRLFRAARAERVSFRRVYRPAEAEPVEESEEDPEPVVTRAGKKAQASQPLRPMLVPPATVAAGAPEAALERVQQVAVRPASGETVPAQSVVKGYEYAKDRYVAIDPAELKSIAPKIATEMQIAEFVRLSEIDPVYFETSYYVVPEQAGEKAYALLYRALQDAGLVALAQFAMHNREHVVVVRAGKHGLIAHTMFYSSEVRADEEYRAERGGISAKELELAHRLIESLAGPFEPEKYRDTYREQLEAILAKKVAGVEQPVEAEVSPRRSTAVIDITAALERSLASLKKPAAKAETAKKRVRSKNAGAS